MGLRFRRSIKICDGLKLNFGKTGMSMTVGSGPLKKTFNTNGNVTTTVGLPGTGIYWTETERRGSRNTRTSTARQNRERIQVPQNDYQAPDAVNDYFSQPTMFEDDDSALLTESYTPAPVVAPSYSDSSPDPNTDQVQPRSTGTIERNCLSADDIKRLYMYSDAPVDWTELIAGASADELLMDPDTHRYCMQMASRILSGDVDAYLEVIERMRPVDDLALYSGDFEFGTDSPSYIEVEFVAEPNRVLAEGSSDALLEEFISAVAVRVARDLFALLPVAKVLTHVEIQGNTVLSVVFTRNQLHAVNFRNNDAVSIINQLPHQISNNLHNLESVNRMCR